MNRPTLSSDELQWNALNASFVQQNAASRINIITGALIDQQLTFRQEHTALFL
jgi:hypothetical protein